jgi:hypothetical protein
MKEGYRIIDYIGVGLTTVLSRVLSIYCDSMN